MSGVMILSEHFIAESTGERTLTRHQLLQTDRASAGAVSFYRAMHFSAKRGIAIACRLSVCPSVCNVGEL